MNTSDSNSSERQIVVRAQAGDREAVGELYARFWRAARAAAFGVVGDFGIAEDAAAEAFRVALTGLGKLRDPDRFAPWLHRIVVRMAGRQLKQTARATRSFEHTMPS